ncbi:ATP-binding protein [Pseudonocardia sp. CA-107938]|uniref:ATP-binding protein n=1 Tax=Pseudonocardia sp. CA-107938 TaxID=3240021 RepID=UPI003D94E641
MRPLLCPTLVGRAAELDALTAAWDAAAHDAGSAVLITGEAGVGKSRMVAELRSRCAADGGVALIGRAVDTATPLPFRPLAEVLLAAERAGVVTDDADVRPFRPALDALLPERVDEPSGTSILQVAEGFLRVCRGIGRRRGAVAVVLEDLHWADAETTAVLDYLADNVGGEPVLLVATARPDLDRPAVGALLAAVDRRSVVRLHLGRLSAAQTVEMARLCLADAPAEVVQFVTERAEGLPFFVEELLTGLQDGPGRPGAVAPVTFAHSVRGRAASLPPAHQDLLVDAALVGRQLDLDLLAVIGGGDRPLVDEMVTGAQAAGLLTDDEWGVRFRHSLTRDVLIAGLRPPERTTRARQALTALREHAPGIAGDERLGAAADLAEWAGDGPGATALLLQAALAALRQGALMTAESALQRARRLTPGGPDDLAAAELLLEVLALAGRVDEAFQLGADVVERLDPALDPGGRRRATAHLAMARCAVADTDWALATHHLALARTDAPDVLARVTTLQAVVALGEYRHADSAVLAAAAVAAAESADADLLCEALMVHGRCTLLSDLEVAEAAFTRAARVAHDAGLAHREARALAELSTVAINRAQEPRRLPEARALAQACGAPETEAVAEQHLVLAAWNRDDAAAMCQHAGSAIAIARRYRLGMLLPSALILLACGHAIRGEADAMEAALAEAVPLIADDPTQRAAVHAQARGSCALARDDVDTAAEELAIGLAIARSSRTGPMPMLGMAVLMAAIDGTDPAPASADLRAMGYHVMRPLHGLLQVADAVRAGRAGAADTAAALFAEGMQELATQAFMRALCWRHVAPSAAADGWGQPVAWLQAAHPIFVGRGLAEPAAAVLTLERRLSAGRSAGGLTTREREVLQLVAEGMPNRSIASRLYLSPRTVEKHVERLLAKTGSANRAQLATYALRNPELSL